MRTIIEDIALRNCISELVLCRLVENIQLWHILAQRGNWLLGLDLACKKSLSVIRCLLTDGRAGQRGGRCRYPACSCRVSNFRTGGPSDPMLAIPLSNYGNGPNSEQERSYEVSGFPRVFGSSQQHPVLCDLSDVLYMLHQLRPNCGGLAFPGLAGMVSSQRQAGGQVA